MFRRAAVVIAGACVLLAACVPLRMGESQAALGQLLERQRACDAKKNRGELTDAKDLSECIDTADGLVALAQEMAQEAGKPGTSAPNAVFFYRRAATAAWRSEQPQAMQEAVTYARAGADLCGGDRSRSEIAPGDCALLSLIPSAVTHDEAMIAFRILKNEVASKTPAEQQRAYVAPAATALPGAAAELNTRLGAQAQRAFEGWVLLVESSQAVCRNDIDASIRNYAAILRDDMTVNLKTLYDTMNATVARGYVDADYGTACRVAKQGDRITGVGISSMAERDDLGNRVNRAAWCRWQTARRGAGEACR